MPPLPHSAAREFAVEVVQRLRAGGFEALWAGGCVRDQLLGRTPKDYDVATNARPEQIRELFGRRRTIEVGAAFGVMTVVGPSGAGHIEVATFRCDGDYQDGRHPIGVTFSTAEHDAQRRDFTINGLFFDPIEERVIDYVGGRDDLQRGVIRAIRDPRERFQEDKLRMLRAVRFAATFGFEIDPATFAAIQELAGEMVIVSAERIAAEMRRMLVCDRRATAVELLLQSRLLIAVLPEAIIYDVENPHHDPAEAGERMRFLSAMLVNLASPDFPTALTVLLRAICLLPTDAPVLEHVLKSVPPREITPPGIGAAICRRWKLANEEIDVVKRLLRDEASILAAQTLPWPKLQRLLIQPHVESLLTYSSAVSRVMDGREEGVAHCREKLAIQLEKFNPPPLITGDDLRQLGFKPSPAFRDVLDAVRDAQLLETIHAFDEAIDLAKSLLSSGGPGS